MAKHDIQTIESIACKKISVCHFCIVETAEIERLIGPCRRCDNR